MSNNRISCNCYMRENDVCPNCVDSCMDDLWQRMMDGTAGRNIIDTQIDIKTFLKSIITNEEFVSQTEKEIRALTILRERQQCD